MILEHIEKLTRICWTEWSISRCVEGYPCKRRHPQENHRRVTNIGAVGPVVPLIYWDFLLKFQVGNQLTAGQNNGTTTTGHTNSEQQHENMVTVSSTT